jgi:S1-C subfamily serine protease
VGLLAWPAAVSAQAQSEAATVQALERAQAAVVGIQVSAVESSRSAETLGQRRLGSGVVIGDDGLVLTIGYLILEAERVDIVIDRNRQLPARVVAYDLASGFGLVQALTPLKLPAARLGDSAAVSNDEPLMIASGGAGADVSLARMVSRRPFSGYWEYHIDGALFTVPPRTDHSGAALFNAQGELLGIGSLIVAEALGAGLGHVPGNMFVPVDLLKPILGELRSNGASRSSARAWLGLNCVEHEGAVRVLRVNRDSPGDLAGLQPGDRILRIDGTEVDGLESFYKALWRNPAAERDVSLEIRRAGANQTLKVHTQDRMKTLSKPQGI